MAAGAIVSATVHDSSLDWAPNDHIVVDQDGNISGILIVDTVDDDPIPGTGHIVTYHILDGGAGYTTEDDLPNFPPPEGPTCLIDILLVESAVEGFTHTFH